MKQPKEVCPTCSRAFKSILDYPRVRILSFERLPIPEAVDTMSEDAARKELERRKQVEQLEYDVSPWRAGINMTPVIERACTTEEVQAYLEHLSSLVGGEVSPKKLLPPFKVAGRFRWAQKIPGTRIYLSLEESEERPAMGRIAEIQVHCDGPNMGSAGGPTLQALGAIARIGYEGLLRGAPFPPA